MGAEHQSLLGPSAFSFPAVNLFHPVPLIVLMTLITDLGISSCDLGIFSCDLNFLLVNLVTKLSSVTWMFHQ